MAAKPSSSTRAGALSRPPLERMLRIHQSISAGQYPNATKLSRELEVSTKSIHRDLEFMRDRLDLPIEYDPQRYGYFYTEEVSGFPTLQITEGELVAMLVAEKALQQYRGTTFERPLISAFKKISASLPDTISLNIADWEQSISFHTRAVPNLDLEVFDLLAKAASDHHRLILHYRKPGAKHADARTVDPYHLANVNGEWFLFAYCHTRQDVRTFAPARILKVETTGERFPSPQDFSLTQRLADSFGVHAGSESYAIRVRFSATVADYIREKQWHPSQKLKECRNGDVELKLQLSSLSEIKRWLLGWEGEAVVMEPPALKNMIQQAARAILDQS